MTDFTQRLPPELLAEILGHVSVPEALRLKQVNRSFRDAVVTSPLIQHKIELFSTGFEYNAAAGVKLADSKEAFLEYRSNLDSFQLNEEVTLDGVCQDDVRLSTAVGGVYAITKNGSLRLFTLGSSSRGVPHREWEIPLPSDDIVGYGFDPVADVIAFARISEMDGHAGVEIHLGALSDGQLHPDAQMSSIRYSRKDVWPTSISSVSMTSSRLAVLMDGIQKKYLVILDWRNMRLLYAAESGAFGSTEFIDDCKLLIGLGSISPGRPSLSLVNTEKNVEGRPTETIFQLWRAAERPYSTLERGGHKLTPVEASASFHQDPAQRIIAVKGSHLTYFVFRAEELLELAEKNEGGTVWWRDWRDRVVVPSIEDDRFVGIRVSGCRFFVIRSLYHMSGCQVEMYDFSVQGRAKYSYSVERCVIGLGVERFLRPTGVIWQIPWEMLEGVCMCTSRDSIVFSRASGGDEDEYLVDILTL